MSIPIIVACTEADIFEESEARPCSRDAHTIACKAHCLEYGHEPTACVFDVCCEDCPI